MKLETITKDDRKITIREARESDAADIVKIYRSVGAERVFITLENYPIHFSNEARFIRALRMRGSYLVVAEHGKKVVGYLRVERHSAPKREHTAEIAMAILLDFRNVGIGSALTAAAVEWAENSSLRKLHLSVFASNTAALALYRKFNFVEEGRRRGQICIDGEYVDEILMARFV